MTFATGNIITIPPTPKRGDTATCAECGQKVFWEYTHKAWGWKSILGFDTTKYCHPFKDMKVHHV